MEEQQKGGGLKTEAHNWNWVRMIDNRPEYGEPVLIKSNGVVQHVTYTRDGLEGCGDWMEPYHFDHDDCLKIPIKKVDAWMRP
jgi:hypothetical protein